MVCTFACGCPQRADEGISYLADEVTDGCKPSDICAENQIQVLCKSSKHPYSLHSASCNDNL